MIDSYKLSDFTSRIHNLFGLQEQGRELVTLVTEATGCQEVCLLFLDFDGEDFSISFCAPELKNNPLSRLKLSHKSPIVKYLRREKKLLTRESLATLSYFKQLRQQNTAEINLDKIELLVPLVSRDRLIGILVLGKKQSGSYSTEDFSLLEDITDRVAVSMEKEYLRQQIGEREKELSVLNRSSTIMTSSLDIQAIFDSFVKELRKVVDVSWAAVTVIEDGELYFLALSSKVGSAWKVGERVASKGTATEWVVTHKKTKAEFDLSQQSQFVTAKFHLKQGVRSIAYLPLIVEDRAIGSLMVASRRPNAYSRRHLILLEQLASQVALPIENTRLYAEVAEKARIDELTGLLNRRSFDEMLVNEVNRSSRYGGVFSLSILDVDSLKTVNDNYGHLAGDELLRQIGGIIKKAIRGADQAFRYGGDEFAILLPNTSIDAAYQVAERIRQQVASEVMAGALSVTASFGLASWPAHGKGASEVMAAADAALYHAKRSGGNSSHCAENPQ